MDDAQMHNSQPMKLSVEHCINRESKRRTVPVAFQQKKVTMATMKVERSPHHRIFFLPLSGDWTCLRVSICCFCFFFSCCSTCTATTNAVSVNHSRHYHHSLDKASFHYPNWHNTELQSWADQKWECPMSTQFDIWRCLSLVLLHHW